MNDDRDLPEQLEQSAQVLADALRQRASVPNGLSNVRLAVAMREVADRALAASVRQARAAGHTWQDLGDVLHTTRQAAFQRFGRPVETDPELVADATATRETLPGAGDRALAIFGAVFAGRDAEVAAQFDETMRAQLPVEKLSDVRLQLRDLVGVYQGAGEPFARRIGKHTVVDVPLEFEASPMKGRVAFDQDGQIAGLFVLNPDAL
jgi:hypothetical protein